MTRPGTVRAVLGAAVASLCLLAAGCVSIPSSGPVQRDPSRGVQVNDTSSYFSPPGPRPGDTRLGIAQGFLIAMQANPLSTTVAQEYLTEDARSSWRPQRRTLVYDEFPVSEQRRQVVLTLAGAEALDGQGRWLGQQQVPARTLTTVREQGEWRISNPLDALIIPHGYFVDRFSRASLMFYDPAARALVPEPVFFPRGDQGATFLVQALLDGPPDPKAARTFAPSGTTLDLSVSISPSGAAEVPLSPQVLSLPTADLRRFAVQLSATLRQVSGIDRVLLTSDGAPVAVGEGSNVIALDLAPTLDPAYAEADDALYALADGRLGRLSAARFRPVTGPLGDQAPPLREAAVSLDATRSAGVSEDGTSLVVTGDGTSATYVGRDVGDLGWDRFGGLWAVDRRAEARVVRITDAGALPEPVEGIDGERVDAFLVSRDGSRLVAAVRNDLGGYTLVVARVERDELGEVVSVSPAEPLPVPDTMVALRSRVGDLSWISATGLAVLETPPGGAPEVERIAVDGSPVDPVSPLAIAALPPDVVELVSSPAPDSGLQLRTSDGKVYRLAPGGGWVRMPLPTVGQLTWVG